jgi:PAS domain S-box-containing protein
MWEKVVLNLLSNALKHTFEGGVTVTLRPGAGAAVLTVADTGTGIPAEELPRLFERFHRVEGARSRSGEGSGIGLALVDELVAMHGGTITADSAPGEGTRFVVTLPLGTAHLPADHIAPAAGEIAVSAAAQPFVTEALRWLPGGEEILDVVDPADDADGVPPLVATGRVIVADDNADMREYVHRLLSRRYDVRLASDGHEALQQALADPPDLVVSDVMMPQLDGMALVEELRADPRTARVPVLLLSARAGQEAAVEGLAAGADDYLVKPFSAEELLARVGAHLRLGRVRRDAEERFTAMADLAPALIWVSDPDGGRTFLNRGWQQFTGRDVSLDLGVGWASGLHPQDRERYAATVGAAVGQRSGWEIDFRLRRADGAYHWLLERAVPIGAGDAFVGFAGSCTDINARHRETERQTLLASLSAALEQETDVEGQLRRLARLTVDRRLADMCTVRRVDESGSMSIAAVAAADPATESVLAALPPSTNLGPLPTDGRAVLHQRIPDLAAQAEGSRASVQRMIAVRSALVVPLSARGRMLAVLGLGRRGDAPEYNDDDRVLIEEFAARAALALDNALLLVEERASAGRLALLQQATAQLSAATTPNEVATVTATYVRRLIGETPELGVFEIDRQQRALNALSLSGIEGDAHGRWGVVALGSAVPVSTAVNQRRPLWIEDVHNPEHPEVRRFPEVARAMADIGIRATVAIPLVAAGRTVGVMGLGYRQPRHLTATEREMLLALAEQCAQALDRARLYRSEQRIAETLQRNLLPQALPAVDRLALAARYLPGAEGTRAGGDWYDLVELDDSRVAIAVGDVVGQGPGAAAVMGQLRSALSTALLNGASPADALELLDRFATRLPGATASTAACLVVDRDGGEVRWSRAGHLPPLLLHPDGAELLDGAGSGTALAVPGRRPYTEGTLPITPGSCLLLFTDGLVERRGEDLDAGLQRLVVAASRLSHLPPERLATVLLRDLLADTDQPDDVALVLARLQPQPLQETHPASPEQLALIRRSVRRWAQAAALDEAVADDLQLAINEAVANSIEHAYAGAPAGHVEYSVTGADDGSVEVCVRDRGRWRPPPVDRGFRGRGLTLIRKLAEDVEVDLAESVGTTVRFRFLPDGDE